MRFKLEPSTRLAIQATVAVALAMLFAPLFHWERSYWAALTAMLMISQTLGDSIKKSVERVSMTIIGGGTGTLLFFITISVPLVQKVLLILSLFFCIFFLNSFYLWSVFFTSLLVVFLFASIQNWTIELLGWRILETIFGASMAIVAAAMILPIRTSTQLQQEITLFTKHLASLTLMGLDALIKGKIDATMFGKQQQNLLNELNHLQQLFIGMRFELVFNRKSRRHLRHQLRLLTYWYDLLSSWLETLKHEAFITTHPRQHELLQQFKQLFQQNILMLDREKNQSFVNLMPLTKYIRKQSAFAIKQKRAQYSDAYRMYHHVHTLQEMNQVVICLR